MNWKYTIATITWRTSAGTSGPGIFVLLAVALYSCIEPFDAQLKNKKVNFLVVDGFVDVTTQTASVKLSRAASIVETGPAAPELNATVKLEEQNGNIYAMIARGDGKYEVSSPEIMLEKYYRIHVRTSDNHEYFSEFIQTKFSPPIDTLFWVAEANGINILLSTHDDAAKSIYYRWAFTETWEYQSALYSGFILENGIARSRPTDQSVFNCFQTELSSDVVIYKTEGFTNDIVNNHQVAFVPNLSEKYKKRYSILVEQHVLSREGYEYWQKLESSNENIGGLFDPQPARVKGNISSTDADETVIGFFDGGSVSKKRLFITLQQLPDYLKNFSPSPCEESGIAANRVNTLTDDYAITSAITSQGIIVAYLYTARGCADCRMRGGTTTKPEFWP